MSNAEQRPKSSDEESAISLEELARRMLTMPVKTREEMTSKKKAKPPRKK
jgi:hypothetical protein